MGKADIKHAVFRRKFPGAIRAVKKGGNEAKHNFVPCAERDDKEQTLENVTCVIEDVNIRLHGFQNVDRLPDTLDNPSGYQVSGKTGTSLLQHLLVPIKQAFAQHARIHTFVLCFDKGCFMPRPKRHTQKNRTATLLDTMDRQQIAPLSMNADGSAPRLVSRDGVLPPWIAVRANRRLFRHTINQLIELLLEVYKPPMGRRLIIDALDMAATDPASVDEWMVSDRLVLDEFARAKVEQTRAALREAPTNEWRALANRVVNELAHAGHLWSVPLCLETSDDGATYAPFLLNEARNNCGEADVGIEFWLHALQSDKQHTTLSGERRQGAVIPSALADYYGESELERHNAARQASEGAQPLSVDERRKRARKALDDNPDLEFLYADGDYERALVAEALPRTDENPCTEPNRMLVLSSDTDFLSLTPIFYAQVCHAHPDDPQYALNNAPLVCCGELQTMQLGWLSAYDEQVVPTSKAERKKRKWDETKAGQLAHELYDVHKLYTLILAKLGKSDASADEKLDAILSFALFCASCENDYLAGLAFVNRQCMFDAFCTMKGELVVHHAGQGAVIMPVKYQSYIKHCYYNALATARGKANKPDKPAAQTSYVAMAELVKRKYKTGTKKHMPDKDRLQLMLQRSQWWIVYATRAWQSIDRLLDDTTWGWPPDKVDLWV